MTWSVLGGTGFVGSALLQHLAAAGVDADPVAAPRLVAPGTADAAELCRRAAADPLVDELADRLRGSKVVVLAAGLATPDAAWSPELVGANASLPAVVAHACDRAGVGRLVHVSSAAVQGRRPRLDESEVVEPFSPYSRSKALGEQVITTCRAELGSDLVVVRATSVQGPDRPTTRSLRRVAATRLATVAGSGSAPSAVSSVGALAAFLHRVGSWDGPVPAIVLQPWEGLDVADVLRLAGGHEPRHLPEPLCTVLLAGGWWLSRRTGGRAAGLLRRVEAMWRGQEISSGWSAAQGIELPSDLARVLSGRASPVVR